MGGYVMKEEARGINIKGRLETEYQYQYSLAEVTLFGHDFWHDTGAVFSSEKTGRGERYERKYTSIRNNTTTQDHNPGRLLRSPV
jgi:hypothetical protein